jgi:hypothetical protein
MSERVLNALRDIMQEDAGGRGLRAQPGDNLITACPDDLAQACHSLAEHPDPAVMVVTGFFIPAATPPAAETDGPLGAVFLARALVPLGVRVVLAADQSCVRALEAGLHECGLSARVEVVAFDAFPGPDSSDRLAQKTGAVSHLIALERVGPSHTPASLRRQGLSEQSVAEYQTLVGPEHHDRCHNMRGLDITEHTQPAHRLFEDPSPWPVRPVTLGIGDGGNEIGMGKISWETIRRNIANGERIACRVATDHLLVAGVSNWGAYALAAGVLWLRGVAGGDLFDPDREHALLQQMVQAGPLVDGRLGQQAATVDGLTWEQYARVLRELGSAIGM